MKFAAAEKHDLRTITSQHCWEFQVLENDHLLLVKFPFAQEITSLSCDNKCKIPIGSLAVSRYHQIRRFFPKDQRSNYPDHDFKGGPYITPCNYLELRHNINRKQYGKGSRLHRSRSTDYTQQPCILKPKRSHSEDTSLFSKCKLYNIQ
ncbi:unnamed protein product, partial [Didymodactylos carnosus]